MHSTGPLRGRVGVITGADSESGRHIAAALAAEGMSLMLIAQPGAHVREFAERLAESHDIRCFPASLDVTDRDAVDRIVMHAEQHVGTIDLLVNTVPGRMTDALLPTMEQRGRGHIVNVEPAPAAADDSAAVEVLNIAADADADRAVLAFLTG
ncbi:MAG: SDR family NAD(P)-dependent oxidoreductase [Aeromicrobium sp.]